MRCEVGVDVVAVGRIQSAIERFGERFLRRVFTVNEQAYCESDKRKWEHFAARFAAKEAVSKALGTGLVGISWTEIEVIHLPSGKPELLLTGRAAARASSLGLDTWRVSLAHDGEAGVAVASVVAIGSSASLLLEGAS
jgi:holo-[acyl-carrier protein] synthase